MNSTKKKVAIMGKKGTVTLFRLFGFQIFEVETDEDVNAAITEVEEKIAQFGMLLLTSDINLTDRQAKKMSALSVPMIVIPMHKSQTGVGHATMERLIEKAVGMKLQFLK
jgi:V/A-type H+/Na+-transporting ATPase subunit F